MQVFPPQFGVCSWRGGGGGGGGGRGRRGGGGEGTACFRGLLSGQFVAPVQRRSSGDGWQSCLGYVGCAGFFHGSVHFHQGPKRSVLAKHGQGKTGRSTVSCGVGSGLGGRGKELTQKWAHCGRGQGVVSHANAV